MLGTTKDLIESNELLAWNCSKDISLYLPMDPAVLLSQICSAVCVRPLFAILLFKASGVP